MPVTLLAIALIGLTRPDVKLTVDVAPGDVVSGLREFRIRTDETKGIVTQIEFYVNHDLRDTVSSIPYMFKLDTVGEEEGTLDLEWRAYTTDGETGKKAVTVRVDNMLSKGPEYHTQKATDLLTDSKWDEAILECRIALKAKAGHNPARVAMARGYLGKGVLDRAQKFAEDAIADEPNNGAALKILSTIHIQRAFGAFSQDSNQAEALNSIRDSLRSAVESTKKTQDQLLDQIKPTAATALNDADLAIRLGRYTIATSILGPLLKSDYTRLEVVNRIAYCQLREGRYVETLNLIETLKKHGHADAYAYALAAVASSSLGDDLSADVAIKEAVLNDSPNVGVLTAQAGIALKRNRDSVLFKLVDQLSQVDGQRPEVQLFMSAALDRQGRYGEARTAFLNVVKADPTFTDAYVMEANGAIMFSLYGKLGAASSARQMAMAEVLFQTALMTRPESAEALTGLAVTALMKKNANEAVRFAQAATVAANSYPAAHYVLSSALKAAGRFNEGAAEALATGRLDKKRLEGCQPPTPVVAWRYFMQHGRTPMIVPPG